MKKLIATTIAVVGFGAYVNAQGCFHIDSTANGGDGATPTSTSGGLVFIQGVLDTASDINMQVLWGTSSSTVTSLVNMDPSSLNSPASTAWLAAQSTGQGDISYPSNGSFTDPNGGFFETGSAVGSVVYLQVEAWLGSETSYSAAVAANELAGTSGIISVTLAATTDVTHIQDMSAISSINLVATSVPEPTSLALAGLGGFGMLMALRRKQA